MKTPIVTIVGRPNVGKSTFFNKLAGARIAIESSEAGTTRDRVFHKVEHSEIDYFLVDTGGLDFGKGETTIETDMKLQTEIAIEESDIIIFMVSAKEELSRDDHKVAELLRKASGNKPVFLVVNKCDNPLKEDELAPLYSLGMGEPHQISAVHRTNLDSLSDQVVRKLKEMHFITKDSPEFKAEEEFNKSHLKIALVGRPNVGKSSLINALLNKDKLIVSDIPGTTRDSTDAQVKFEGKSYNFIDTAGLRKRGKIGKGIEHFSALRSMAAIERCDIAILVIDSSQPIGHQDQQIVSYVLEAHKGLIILANKWDIKDPETNDEEERRNVYLKKLRYKFGFLSWAPLLFTSAKTKKNLTKIFELIEGIGEERKKRIQTRTLNNFVDKVNEEHKPTGTKNVRPKLFYITQVGIEPPHLVAFVNKKKYFHFTYWRFLQNRIREAFGFNGTPIKLEFKEKEARYSKKK